MKKLLATTALVFATQSPAQELGFGVTHAQLQQNGMWYQQGLPYTTQLNSASVQFGYKYKLTDNVKLHTKLVWLGSSSLNSWATPNDNNYSLVTKQCIGPCLPLVNYQTSGSMWGFALPIEFGNKRAGFLVGPWIYSAQFRVWAPNWYSTSGTPGNYTVLYTAPFYSNKQRWAVSSYLGVALHRQQWSLYLTKYRGSPSFGGHEPDPWPPLWQSHFNLTIAKEF